MSTLYAQKRYSEWNSECYDFAIDATGDFWIGFYQCGTKIMQVNKIIQGDSLEVLKTMPSESIDCVITSPPYFGLRSYLKKDDPLKSKEIGSESSVQEHIKVLLDIFAEVKRVLKKEGNFWLNYGDCYGGTKIGNTETIKNPRQVQQDSLQNLAGYEKSLMMLPERIALKMVDEQGWILRDRICWAKQIYLYKDGVTKGSAMPSSVKDRFNNTWEYLYHFTKNKKYFFDLDAVRIPIQTIDREKEYPNAKRNANAFNYRVRDAVKKTGQPQFKASEEEIRQLNYKQVPKEYGKKKLQGIEDTKLGNRWMSGTPNFVKQRFDISKRQNELVENGIVNSAQRLRGFYDTFGGESNPAGKNIPNVWLIGTEPSRELHFARFPSAICDIPIKASCPPNGIVMDIFAGSGTALQVAHRLGRRWVGIELNEKYVEIANRLFAPLLAQPNLL